MIVWMRHFLTKSTEMPTLSANGSIFLLGLEQNCSAIGLKPHFPALVTGDYSSSIVITSLPAVTATR